MRTSYGWAIHCTYTELDGTVGEYLAGRYYFSFAHTPDCLDGYTQAVFSTRRKARSALAGLKRGWEVFGTRFKPRVVKVKVEVTECPG